LTKIDDGNAKKSYPNELYGSLSMNIKHVRLGKIQSSLILLTLIVRNLGGLVLGRTFRDGARVEADYDQGCWKEMLSNRAWEQFPSLNGFLCERGDGSKIAKIDNQLVRIHAHEYAKFRVEKISL
jgi:hypothetical protein